MNGSKKLTPIIIGIVALIAIIGITVLFKSLNTTKKPITAEEFKEKMETKEFVVQSADDQFKDYSFIKKVYIAAPKDHKYQIEFYEIEDKDNAIKFYNNNKKIFENSASAKKTELSNDKKNSSKYMLTSNEKYKAISRIDNTVIYLDIDKKYKKDVDDILKELGY